MARVHRELHTLRRVTSHSEKALERAGLHLAHELRDAIAQRGSRALLVGIELVGDLQHVADDDLIVRRVALVRVDGAGNRCRIRGRQLRSEEHTSELQSRQYLVCRLLLEKKKKNKQRKLSIKKKHTKKQ